MIPEPAPSLTAQPLRAQTSNSPSPSGAPAAGTFSVGAKNQRQYQEAVRRSRLVAAYRSAQLEGLKPDDAAAIIRSEGEQCSRTTLDRWCRAMDRDGFSGLMDHREQSGRRRRAMLLTDTEARLIRARVLATTNRTSDSGSVPEAMRQAALRGEIQPEVAAEWSARERDGRGVPDALRRELVANPAAVRQLRGPTDAGLDYLSAPGSLMWIKDERSGEERFVRVGDVLEADDATINFPVCVPWELGGCRCSDRWGVKVSRFQWLVAIDRASRFIPGWSYVMRPRSSYRAEDVLSMFAGVFRQHGVWRRLCLERGTWESNAVGAMIEGLGVRRMTAWTPHQKPFIEGLFNSMWTKLSDMPGQVGRSRGEEEKTDALVRSCQSGATDPRGLFPMMGNVLTALASATGERNRQPIHSENYGTWVPEERWSDQLEEARSRHRLRPLAADSAWMFSPVSREWTVQGGLVGGTVQIMEELSVRFDFAAEWLTGFHGAKVRCHFDPAAPQAEATLVLLENVRDHRAGEVLGTAVQVNKVGRYARRVLGWGDDPDLGRDMRKIQATAMRAEVRAILPGGESGLSVSRLRDGCGREVTVERGACVAPESTTPPIHLGARESSPTPDAEPSEAPRSRRGSNPLAPSTPEQFRRRSNLTAQLAAVSRGDDDDAIEPGTD